MPINKLKKYLNENDVKYVTIQHSSAFTAQEIAESAHISGKELAKVVIVNIDGELAMVVLPASENVDCGIVSKAANGATVLIAGEDEFTARFADCEIGAMPPFGNLYDMKIYLVPTLAEDSEIAFNAGSHTELIKLKYSDFERLAKDAIIELPAGF